MTDQAEPELELYRERGSSWWPVLWGPLFAAVGAGVESTSGPVHGLAWTLVGIGLAVLAVVWVVTRRRVCSVRLTPKTLYQGRETLAVQRIVKVDEVGASLGARVLGGGLAVPRKFVGVPVQLDSGSTVLAWARDGEALRKALSRLVRSLGEGG